MEKDGLAKSSDTSIEKEGFISQILSKDGIPNQSLANDHIGIENISVEPSQLYEAVSALKNYGFNYLPKTLLTLLNTFKWITAPPLPFRPASRHYFARKSALSVITKRKQ